MGLDEIRENFPPVLHQRTDQTSPEARSKSLNKFYRHSKYLYLYCNVYLSSYRMNEIKEFFPPKLHQQGWGVCKKYPRKFLFSSGIVYNPLQP